MKPFNCLFAPDDGTGAPPAAAPAPAAPVAVPPVDPSAVTPAADPWAGIVSDGKLTGDYLTRLPEPLAKVIKDNMTSARAKATSAAPVDVNGYALVPPPDAVDAKAWKPDGWPDGASYDADFMGAMLPVMHKAGLPPEAARELATAHAAYFDGKTKEFQAAVAAEIEQEKAALKGAFGGTLPAVAKDVQDYLTSKGLKPDVMDPSSGEFGQISAVEQMKIFHGLISEIKMLRGEGARGPVGMNNVDGGADYYRAVIAGKHPDSAGYLARDPDITAKMNRAMQSLPATGP
jgi:hypothetical protein